MRFTLEIHARHASGPEFSDDVVALAIADQLPWGDTRALLAISNDDGTPCGFYELDLASVVDQELDPVDLDTGPGRAGPDLTVRDQAVEAFVAYGIEPATAAREVERVLGSHLDRRDKQVDRALSDLIATYGYTAITDGIQRYGKWLP